MVAEVIAKPQRKDKGNFFSYSQGSDAIRDKKSVSGKESLCFEAMLLIDFCDSWGILMIMTLTQAVHSSELRMTHPCIVYSVTGIFHFVFFQEWCNKRTFQGVDRWRLFWIFLYRSFIRKCNRFCTNNKKCSTRTYKKNIRSTHEATAVSG